MKRANLLLLGILWIGPAFAADEAGTSASPGATTTKASEMDCDKLQEKVLGQLDRLKIDPDSIESTKCQLSSKAAANSEQLSVDEEKVNGACQATYLTINHYADLSKKKLAEVCSVIRSAKDVSSTCENQKNCMSNLAGKDKSAGTKLKELSAILKKAQQELATRQKNLAAVAEKYKKTFAKIDEAIRNAGPSGNVESTLTGLSTDGIFGADSPNAWAALFNNGFQSSNFDNTWSHYKADLEEGFDNDGKAAPKGLGKYTEELAAANTSAARAIKTVDTAAPRISSAQEHFESRSSDLTGLSRGLSGFDGLTSLTNAAAGTKAASTALSSSGANAASAAAAAAAGSGLADLGQSGEASADSSAATGAQAVSAGGGTKVSAPSSLGNTAAALAAGSSADVSVLASSATTAAAAAAAAASPTGAAQPAGEPGKNELLSSFTTLGPVSEGDETDVKAARLQAGKNAVGLSAAGTYLSTSGRGSAAPAATSSQGDPAMGGGGSGVKNSASKGYEPSTFVKPGSKEESLRDALRRRLAERTKAGDASASAAVEELLYASDRAPASAHESGEAAAEQAGPLGIESEPLFSRVHHAYRRFLQRTFPRQAGL